MAVVAGVGASGRIVGRDLRAVESRSPAAPAARAKGVRSPDGRRARAQRAASPWRVPNDVFYRIDTALVLPVIDPAEWTLRVHGLVDQELAAHLRRPGRAPS